ncbi:unnamed protein product [Rotaria sp. Silwood1]|nr:unnamed protein product [Rotaria sp. Silwood1]
MDKLSQSPKSDLDKQLELAKLRLAYEQEKTKQEEAKAKQEQEDAIIEQAKAKQEQADAIIEQAKAKQKQEDAIIEQAKAKQKVLYTIIEQERRQILQLEVEKRKLEENIAGAKRLKTYDEQVTATSDRSNTSSYKHHRYYKFFIKDDIKKFSIKSLLYDIDNINDNMIQIFEESFQPFISQKKILQDVVQSTLNDSINKLFDEFNNYTSLKCLNTSSKKYLKLEKSPDCTFIYKNINIDIKDQCTSLEDFVIFVGEFKSTMQSIDSPAHIAQLCEYLVDVLMIQNRKKVYGFITNLQFIRFYYVEKEQNSLSFKYYQSEKLKMFYMPSNLKKSSSASSSSAVNKKASNNEVEERVLVKDTIKIFIKFLTMTPDFYQYTMLPIDPDDYFFDDQYYIKRRIGSGLTSMVYSLINANYNETVTDETYRIMKICKDEDYCELLMNEIDIVEQLKSFNDRNNFNLFFLNIEEFSDEGNTFLLSKLIDF